MAKSRFIVELSAAIKSWNMLPVYVYFFFSKPNKSTFGYEAMLSVLTALFVFTFVSW